MAKPSDLAKMVPGFEFLQNLMKGATANLPGLPGLPSMGQWVAPTLDPAELEKRIQELKTVQFWLDSNVKLLGATIQALEVQRMTLATFQTMNMPLADLRDALKINLPKTSPWAPSSSPAPPPAREPASTAAREPAPETEADEDAAADTAGSTARPAIDPLQWWGALTQQFTELATQAMKDTSADTARSIAGAAARQAAAGRSAGLAKKAATAGKPARKRS